MTVEWLSPLGDATRSGVLVGKDEELSARGQLLCLAASIGLVAMAGLCSGLTLGLMSLDEVDLEVLKRSGTESEKRHARRIQPVIANEHFLLVTLLLFNALSTEALPLFLDRLVDPVSAVVLSVTVVLVIGEILPQAVCRSYGLQVGSYSAWLVRGLMALSSPITWPVGKLLDWLLGGEHTALFRRAQLKALVGLHSSGEGLGGELTADEISIITGALDLTSKTASSAMTPLAKVFMLPADRWLDESALQEILVSGHSRVPVHEPGDRTALLGLILVKELVLVDPAQGLTAGALVSRTLPRLPADLPMYQLLRLFEAGGSHMVALTRPQGLGQAQGQVQGQQAQRGSQEAGQPGQGSGGAGRAQDAAADAGPLRRIRSGVIKSGDSMLYIEAQQSLSPRGLASPGGAAGPGGGDAGGAWGGGQEGAPVGIITIEDVIEELLQQEIIDETDNYVDNLQVTRVDAFTLTSTLPPRLRKAYAQQFTPRVGRLVAHAPSHHHAGAPSATSWHRLAGFKHQGVQQRSFSNPTTPLASADATPHGSPEQQQQQQQQQQAGAPRLGAGSAAGAGPQPRQGGSRLGAASQEAPRWAAPGHGQGAAPQLQTLPEQRQLQAQAPPPPARAPQQQQQQQQQQQGKQQQREQQQQLGLHAGRTHVGFDEQQQQQPQAEGAPGARQRQRRGGGRVGGELTRPLLGSGDTGS